MKNKNMEDAGTYQHIEADKQKFPLGFTICSRGFLQYAKRCCRVCVEMGLVYASITHCIYANAAVTVRKNL